MDPAYVFDGLHTTYTITDEVARKSTITIDKWCADLLQDWLPDVHAWIQAKYDKACERFPLLSRREKGDFVRQLASFEARKNPDHQKYLDSF